MTDRVLEFDPSPCGEGYRAERAGVGVTPRIHAGALRAFAIDAVRYFGVSVAALAVDYGLLVCLHRAFDLHYLVAATLSFLAGLAVAWSLSVVFVFRNRRRLSPWREFLGFAATGLAGLLLTQMLLSALVGGFGVAPEFAKIPVSGVVFAFNFVSRRLLLFTAPASSETIFAATGD